MKYTTTLLLLLLLSSTVLSQRTEPASEKELAEITARGRMLFDYDVAAWNSTDAVLALKPEAGSFDRYVARKTGNGWTVAYGKLNTKQDKFLIAYEAVQGATPTDFNVTRYEKPKETAGFYLLAGRALDLVRDDFGAVARPYNAAVLPAAKGQLYVYLVPAQTEVGVYPIGGDVRYLVAADGRKIVKKRQLHNAIIEFRSPKGVTPKMSYQTAILDDVPEDTDVFHVLARKPAVESWIFTDKFVYRILPDGTATYLMNKEAFLRIGKPADKDPE